MPKCTEFYYLFILCLILRLKIVIKYLDAKMDYNYATINIAQLFWSDILMHENKRQMLN